MRRNWRGAPRPPACADHRAWAHALPVLQGPRRLGGGARRQGARVDPGRGQRRHRQLRRAERALRPSGADAVMIGRGAQGRPWFPGQLARYLAGGRAESTPPLPAAAATDRALYDEMLTITARASACATRASISAGRSTRLRRPRGAPPQPLKTAARAFSRPANPREMHAPPRRGVRRPVRDGAHEAGGA